MARMKMRDEDFERLRAAVKPLDTGERRNHYRQQGLTGKRYRWDLLHLSGFQVTDLYAYLNDVHIDTALLRIVQPGLLK